MTPNEARETFQAALLAAIFREAKGKEIVLKGGMALRAAHQSLRYTKDLDFDADPRLDAAGVKAKIKRAIAKVRTLGLVRGMTVTEPKQTETTMRWKIAGRIANLPVNMAIEVLRRDPLPEQHVKVVSYAPPAAANSQPIMLTTLDAPALAANKVSCLVDINRDAVRDLLDLGLLNDGGVEPDPDLVKERLASRYQGKNRKDLVEGAQHKIETMTWSKARDELLPFLGSSDASRIDETYWEGLRVALMDLIEKWVPEMSDAEPSSSSSPTSSPSGKG
ncbi:MAG: nucleotidyl transferase AbiEii/AbiGii toxin family protein [Alphaproteobacteria bacterium]|nr:nucleotidyl transferase AbiEii/AbiGii toxin family protein [Alphaproteobacteria bacterium]